MLNPDAEIVAMALYDRLISVSPAGEIVPYLAESWDVTATEIKFVIREGATCSDGTPVTPQVIADSFKWLLSEELGSPWPASRWEGDGPYTITADNAARTVTFSRPEPNSLWLTGFTRANAGGIMCPAGTDKFAEEDFLETSYGSGPYVLTSVVPGDRVVLTRRDDWTWGGEGMTAANLPATITYKVVGDPTSAANLLLTGGLDAAALVGVDAERMRSEDLIETKTVSLTSSMVQYGHDPSRATADKVVRQAVSTAIDLDDYNLAATNGTGTPARSYFAEAHPCFDPAARDLHPATGDTDAARAILLANGYTSDAEGNLQKDGQPLAMTLIASDSTGDGPAYVTAQLVKMGIAATLNKTDESTHRTNLWAGDWDLAFRPDGVKANPGNRDSRQFTGGFRPDGPNNSRTVDPALDQLVADAVADPTCAGWQAWEKRILTEFHGLPLVFETGSTFSRAITYVANQDGAWFIRTAGG
jgi:peptide/nickel transport system substrate-binding protein